MPIKLDNKLPALDVLRSENVFIMDENRASSQDIRPMLIDSAFRNKQRIGDLVVRLAAADVQQDLRLALRKLFGTILRHRRRSRFEVAYQIEQQLLREKTSSVDHRFDRGYDVLDF